MKLGWGCLDLQWSGSVTILPFRLPVSVSSCLCRRQHCCQYLKQHMLSLGPSATECDGEKEGLECEVLLSVLWICLYLNLGHHSLESWSGGCSSGGLHKGSKIWEAVQRSEGMLRHRGQLKREKSAVITYKKGKERIGEIYLQTLLIGTWKEWEVFSPSRSADSCSLPLLEAGSS